MQKAWVWSLGWEDPLEKEMVTYFSILAWEIPWREEPGKIQSMGLQKSQTKDLVHKEMFLLYLICWEILQEWMLNFVKCLFYIYWDDHVISSSILLLWCITFINLHMLW